MSAYIRKRMALKDTFPIWQDVAAIWIADSLRVNTLRDCPNIDENGLIWMQRYMSGEDVWFAPETPCLVSLHAYEGVALKQLDLFESNND